MEIYNELIKAIEKKEAVSLVTITKISIKKTNSNTLLDEHLVGKKMIVWTCGKFRSEAELPQDFINKVKDRVHLSFQNKQSKTYELSFEGINVECYVEICPPPPSLIVAGAGHIAKPVIQIANMLGFHTTVIDDRQQYANLKHFPWADEVKCESFLDFFKELDPNENTFILLLTRGHKFDVLILPELFDKKIAYIGMIGSQRRISGVFSQLKEEYPQADFNNIYSPVGLDLGAQTPEEIALSIMAEILKVKNNTTGVSLNEKVPFFIKQREGVDKK